MHVKHWHMNCHKVINNTHVHVSIPGFRPDGGLVKEYPWMIWVIIDTTHPAFRKSRLGGAWRVVCYK